MDIPEESEEIPEWVIRLNKILEERGITKAALARNSGLKEPWLSRLLSGDFQDLKQARLNRLAVGLSMPATELRQRLYGKESLFKETHEQILERLRVTIPFSVPIYEEYRAHYGESVEITDYVAIAKERAKGRRLEGYIGHGECLSPVIQDGDIVIIDRDGPTDNGDIVACLVEGELHIARLKMIAGEPYLENNHGRIKLESDAEAHPVIEVRRRLK